MFAYGNWKVYRLAVEMWEIALELSRTAVKGCANELAHLRETASSTMFNLAEGCKRTDKGSKLHFYDIARGSTGEYNSALVALLKARHPQVALINHAKGVANHCSALTTNLIRRVEKFDDRKQKPKKKEPNPDTEK